MDQGLILVTSTLNELPQTIHIYSVTT